MSQSALNPTHMLPMPHLGTELDLPREARKWLAAQFAEQQRPKLESLPKGNRVRAAHREVLVKRVEALATLKAMSNNAAVSWLLEHWAGEIPAIHQAAEALARKNSRNARPSRASLLRWCADYARRGAEGLADNHTGRKREWYGWEQYALAMWLTPSKPDAGSIGFWLREDGYESATNQRVRAFLNTLPESMGRYSRYRMGQHHHDQNTRPYVMRDYSKIPVGFMYEGDGHTCDWYCAHPRSGNVFRPEFTPWIDWRSHYIPGWYLWQAESGLNTLLSLSRALANADHVPAAIHVDPGSGFKNRMMTDESTGFLARLSIRPVFALPGNARGKGLVEGFFKHFEARLGKSFNTYCGHDRTDDGLRRMQERIKRGDLVLPTFEETLERVGRYIDAYNRAPQASLGGRAPIEVWEAQLQRVPLELPAEALLRIQEVRKVSHSRVKLRGRTFQAAELSAYEKTSVHIEYDLFSWDKVWVFDTHQRFVCFAMQVERHDALPESVIADMEQTRLEGQQKRLQKHLEEKRAQAGLETTHADRLQAVEALQGEPGAALGAELSGAGFDLVGDLDLGELADTYALALGPDEFDEHEKGAELALGPLGGDGV